MDIEATKATAYPFQREEGSVEIDRLFELEPEPDPPPCKCKPKWLTPIRSEEPDLYEAWICSQCGERVIRAVPHP